MTRVDHTRAKVIACATVIEEMLPLMPPGLLHQTLDFGLHISPDRLRASLQDAIDSSGNNIEAVVLGYGLCAQAVVGLRAGSRTLIVPRVEDCIAIFLGSDLEYRKQHKQSPGTYYLTKGWIEVGSSPFGDYQALVERYGEKKAELVMSRILKNYTRLVLINTGQEKMEYYRSYTQEQAARFGLRYEEIQGSNSLVKKMINGQFDSDFIVVRPGETILFRDFMKTRV
jgi:hypothetical protein